MSDGPVHLLIGFAQAVCRSDAQGAYTNFPNATTCGDCRRGYGLEPLAVQPALPVPRLHVAKLPPNHALADRIRKLLARVESGELQSLVWVGEFDGGGYISGHEYAPGVAPARMLGEVALVQQRLALAELERRNQIERV